jgi:hypothetical protein
MIPEWFKPLADGLLNGGMPGFALSVLFGVVIVAAFACVAWAIHLRSVLEQLARRLEEQVRLGKVADPAPWELAARGLRWPHELLAVAGAALLCGLAGGNGYLFQLSGRYWSGGSGSLDASLNPWALTSYAGNVVTVTAFLVYVIAGLVFSFILRRARVRLALALTESPRVTAAPPAASSP